MKKLITTIFSLLPLASFAQANTIDLPTMGWSSWNTYHVNISDSLIVRQADAMVAKGLKAAGYLNVNIDDGFFGYRDENGKMHPHPQRFPNGLRWVSDHIHSLGLIPGIYSDAGGNTCGSMYDDDPNGIGAGMYGHEEQDADLYFNEWNFDFIKIDYCGAGHQLNLDEEKRYGEIKAAIDRTVKGKKVAINICRWAFPGTWAKHLAKSWRISPDIRPRWSSVKRIIEMNMYLSAYCSDGHYNDMDMLEVGRGMKPNEDEVHFGMWCLLSSPLLIGCDLTTIKEPALNLIKNPELIALNQDPLGLQAYVVQHDGEGYVFVKDILKERGRTRAVALYNPSDSVCRFSVPLSVLEFEGKVKLRDLIKREDMKSVKDSIVRELPARSVLILRAEGDRIAEPSLYEAEWAYLPCYDNLGKRKKLINYTANEHASGGMVVSYLGGRKENTMIWDKVYSAKGGRYEMTITYVPEANRKIEVWVNGEMMTLPVTHNSKSKVQNSKFTVSLRAGYNKVELGNRYGWACDVDKMELKKL